MADRGRPRGGSLPRFTVERIIRLVAHYRSIRRAARELWLSRNTVRKYIRAHNSPKSSC